MQTRMYMVIGTEPGARPARAAPASISARLAAMRAGVAQFSSAPSALLPGQPQHLRAERGQVHRGRWQVLDPERGGLRPPGETGPDTGPAARRPGGDLLAVQQRPDLGHVLTHDRDRAVGQAHRRPELGPVAPGAQAEHESARGQLGQRGRLQGQARRGPHPRRRDDGDPGAQRGVLRPGRADVERVRHRPGRGPQALEAEPAGLPGPPPAVGRTPSRAGHPVPRQSS